MQRIIYFTNERDPAVSAKWPPYETCSVAEQIIYLNRLEEDRVDKDENVFVIPEHHLDATVREFYAWMIEHCASAIYVNRGQEEDLGGFTYEWLICDPDQAFAYRMRWGPCVFIDC